MLRHEEIWAAIDALAARNGLSVSGLAKKAGLDPTTFNRSKRLTPEGRQRWPSTESVAKILVATNETLDNFVSLISTQTAAGTPRLPLITSSAASRSDSFTDAGVPAGSAWQETALQGLSGEKCFALEIESAALTPLYREGTLVIAMPGDKARRGDRVIVRLRGGRLMIGEVRRETTGTLDLARTGEGDEVSVARAEILSIARIHWASQ